MRKVSNNELKKSNDICADQFEEVYVGLDVHKKTIHAAVWIDGKVRRTWSMSADPSGAVRSLRPYQAAIKRIVYEAGPTGYGLARKLRQSGMPVWVIAPGATPRPSVRENKSDRLDCRKLAEYAAAGLLRETAVPTPEQEASRQLARLRDQQARKRRRVKQQIKSFMLQHGIATPEGMENGNWSKSALHRLSRVRLRVDLRFCLDRHLSELSYMEDQIKQTEKQLREMVRRTMKTQVERLRTHPGVGPLVATTFAAELYQPERFEHGGQVARYLGLAPQVRQSGQTRREGPILKTGRESMRSLLIEAAWQWIRYDRAAAQIYQRLVSNTGLGKKAIVAMARRMAVNLWTMLMKEEDYRSPRPEPAR